MSAKCQKRSIFKTDKTASNTIYARVSMASEGRIRTSDLEAALTLSDRERFSQVGAAWPSSLAMRLR
jgi:hypothetical protein